VVGYNNPSFKGGPIPTRKNYIWPKKRQKIVFFRNGNGEEKSFLSFPTFKTC
jgi:hypothetical protein